MRQTRTWVIWGRVMWRKVFPCDSLHLQLWLDVFACVCHVSFTLCHVSFTHVCTNTRQIWHNVFIRDTTYFHDLSHIHSAMSHLRMCVPCLIYTVPCLIYACVNKYMTLENISFTHKLDVAQCKRDVPVSSIVSLAHVCTNVSFTHVCTNTRHMRTHVNTLCHTFVLHCVMSHLHMCVQKYDTLVNKTWHTHAKYDVSHTCKWVMSHIHESCHTSVNTSCHTYVSYVTNM